MITRINESKTLTKHISCKCRFDGRKCDCGIMINVDVSVKNEVYVEKTMESCYM